MKKCFAAIAIAVAVFVSVTPVYASSVVGGAIVDIASKVIKWCVTPTTANEGEDEYIAAINYLNSVWRAEGNTSGTVDVTYQTLSDVAAQLNMNGVPCKLKQLRGSGVTGYVIMGMGPGTVLNGYGTYSFTGKYFTNTAGAMFRAAASTDSDVSADTSGILTRLGDILNRLKVIELDLTNGFNSVYGYLSTINNNICLLCDSVAKAALDRQSIYSLLSVIDVNVSDFLDKLDTLSDGLTTLSGKLDVQTESLESIASKLALIITNTGSSDVHLDHIEALQTKWLPALGDNISTLNSNVMSVYTSVSNTLAEVMDVNTTLTSIEASANSAALDVDSIFSFLTNENGPIYATALNASNISAKLDDLHVTTDFTDTNIVSAINNLASLFSLGETQTIEAKSFVHFQRGSLQSVSVNCFADGGFTLFADGLFSIDSDSFSFSGVTSRSFFKYSSGRLGSFEINQDMNSLDGEICDRGYDVVADVNIVLLDSSGAPIPLKTGDLIRPTATVGRWAVVRTTGEIIEIADCTGLSHGLSFGDILPRAALVPIHDLVAAPSLFTSYCDQVCIDDLSQCYVFNLSNQPLTAECVNPSSLLNWYANRQNDFRYWLDTRLSNLPVAQPADLTALQATLTTLESTLSSTEYFAPVITGIDTVNANVTALNTSLNANLDSLVDKLQIVVDNSTTNVENVTNVVIEETNNAYNVFYVTTDDGEKKSIGEVSGDALTASGKLLNFLYKLCFESALSKVDDSITNMDGFYFDDAAGLEGSIWD